MDFGISEIAALGLAASVASAGVGAAGAISSGERTAAAARYNAQIQQENAQIARQNATFAGAAGEAQAARSEMSTRATVGSLKTNQAAAGVDVNTGSPVDVRASAADIGKLDALTIRSNAAREAYGYQASATSSDAQAKLDLMQAESATTAGALGGASTFLGGAGNAALNWAKWQQASGGSFGGYPGSGQGSGPGPGLGGDY